MLFEDRLEVVSPGRLPGLVRVQNIQNARYSRNPHIARVLAEMTGYVRELNEGVRRIFDEMRSHGLQEPVFQSSGTSVTVVLYTQPIESNQTLPSDIASLIGQIQRRLSSQKVTALLTSFASRTSITTREVTELIGMSVPTARRCLSELERFGIVAEDRTSKNEPRAAWRKTQNDFWAPGELERTLKSLL